MAKYKMIISEILDKIDAISVSKDYVIIDSYGKVASFDIDNVDLKYAVGNHVCVVFDLKETSGKVIKKIIRCGGSLGSVKDFVKRDYGGGSVELDFR